MEAVSKQLIAALGCGLAGPVAALGAMHLAAGALVGELALQSADLGEILAGVFVAAMVLWAVGVLVGAAATAAALVVSGTPHPARATGACLLLALCWAQAAIALDLAMLPTALLLGLVPALVRVVDGLSAPSARAGRPG